MTSLAETFRRSGSNKIKWQGQAVHSYFNLAVRPGDVLEVSRHSSSPERAQAINLAVDKGSLRANGVLVETAAVWTHNSPEVAQIEVVGRKARSVDIWNSWSFEGVDSAWLGNAGMLIDERAQEVKMQCSDGLGDVSFDNLVITITITHHD